MIASESIRNTVLWWTAYLIITPIVLAVAARAKTPTLQNRLRWTFVAGEIVAIALFIFPFALDTTTGFGLVSSGHMPTIATGLGIFFALMLTIAKTPLYVWVGSILHVTASVTSFVWLANLQGNSVLNPPLAPIIFILLLLVLNVIALSRLDGLPLPKGNRRTVAVWSLLLLSALGGIGISAMWQRDTATTGLTPGMLTGSVSYPSEEIPNGLMVCAEEVEARATRCTRPYQSQTTGDFITGTQFTYGIGYSLPVLPGVYHVFAKAPLLPDTRAYYTALSPCAAYQQQLCSDHTILPVTVRAGKTTSQTDPTDWYAPPAPATGNARATDAVLALTEVQEYLAGGPARVVQAESPPLESEPWSVHVFEILNDHTATFNWYKVDQKTGEVTSAF